MSLPGEERAEAIAMSHDDHCTCALCQEFFDRDPADHEDCGLCKAIYGQEDYNFGPYLYD